MTAPVPYARLKNFTQFALQHTEDPYNASDHDAEFNAVMQTLIGVLSNRAFIQRDDGALANDSVHPDSLSTATLLLIEAAGSATGLAGVVRGLWTTSTAYLSGQIVQNLTTSYISSVAHTSGTFATDFTAGKWIILGETAAAGASVISFTPAGNIAAVNVQAAIQELDGEKAALAGSAVQPFSIGDATTATQAASAGQLQSNSLKSATGLGTADAMLATVPSGLTVLTDGMEFIVEAPGTNTLTAPTFNLTLGSTATGAKTIVKGNNIPLLAGDIASNRCKVIYDISLDKWVLINPLYQVGLSASSSAAGGVKNLGLAFTVGANALSASVVTATGSTPTPGAPIEVAMRSSNATLGTFNVRTITAALALTISSGSTLYHVNGITSRIHWYLIDNAGTLELAASSLFFGFSGLVTTVAEGGAGAADTYEAMYSATARASVPYVWIGETTDNQITAGTWLSVPTLVNTVPSQVVDRLSPSEIIPIYALVSGNALTMTLYPCVLDFRSPTLGSGLVNRRVVSAPIQTVISSGSTAGTTNGGLSRLVLFAMDNNGTVELAWVNALGAVGLYEDGFLSTLAEGGAGAADSGIVAYSAVARTNLPYRIIGLIESTQAAAGTWAAAPSKVQGAGGTALSPLFFPLGVGQVWQNLTASRAAGITYTNTGARPIVVHVSATGTVAAVINMVITGGNTMYGSSSSAGGLYLTIDILIPAGFTYNLGVSAGTLTLAQWWELRV
jgi:hypothetical protein